MNAKYLPDPNASSVALAKKGRSGKAKRINVALKVDLQRLIRF